MISRLPLPISLPNTTSEGLTLDEIGLPVEQELKAFRQHFRQTMISEVPLVNLLAKYIVRTKGKQVRPLLVLLSAQACGAVSESTYRAATLVELLHTATLIHDDVVDDADLRRGFPSIKALWKNKVGVLMGDYLLAKGLLLTVDTGEFHFLQITSRAVRRMSEGELYQLQKARQLNIDEAAYFRIIADKTASLLSTCCEMGAASVYEIDVEKRQRYQTALRDYGEAVGIAFQLRDDLFDYLGEARTIGKPVAIDLKERKLTLPLIHSLEMAGRSTARHILSLIKKKDAKFYPEIVSFVRSTGGIDYAIAKMEEYAQRAYAAIAPLEESDAKESLRSFIQFSISREK